MSNDFTDITKVKKTRKQHTCENCYIKIPSGESAFKYVGKHAGDFNSVYICVKCEAEGKFYTEN